jgi:N-acetylglucosamine kinase-like BadF-type ATPase
MRLIIDSGSTKMDWILLDGKTVKNRFTTNGFNPNYSDIQCLGNMVSSVETCHGASLQDEIQFIYYYGTGCGTEKNCQLIKEVFQSHFPNAKITIIHDIVAACHALLGHEKGIACILGTGSNACLYDGENITESAISLGYLVGDEGSGMHIGREVVRAYFYGFMPENLRQQFDDAFHLELKGFIQQLYHNEQPSKYLASFAKFAGEHQDNPFIHDIVVHCFNEFIKAFILRFDDCKSLKISFIGSVAFHFQDILRECIKSHDLTMGEVMTSPAAGLVRYYSE